MLEKIAIVDNNNFEVFNIFAIGEELRILIGKKVDAYEISEINKNSDIYINILKEGVEIIKKEKASLINYLKINRTYTK